MNTVQHTLVTLLNTKDINKFEEQIAYVLFPDAIRRYTKERQYSHFEKTEDGSDVSWLKYPEQDEVKKLDGENVKCLDKHYAKGIRPCVLGEETDLESFEKHNSHLKGAYYYGVKKHLNQDHIYDEAIREWIDCSKKYDDEFEFNGKKLNGKEVRSLIANIENYGIYVLAKKIYEEKGITVNQQWLDENIKPILDKVYSQDLSDGTYKYMNIPEEMNKWITEHDWSHINEGEITYDEYEKIYKKVHDKMGEIDLSEEVEKKKNDEQKKGNVSLKGIMNAIKERSREK